MRHTDRPNRRRIPGRAVACIALAMSPELAYGVADTAAEDRLTDRRVQLCSAWNAVKYLEPSLWSGSVDWDQAFVQAATAVDGESPTAAFRAIAEQMLGAVGDPGTRVTLAAAPAAETAATPAAPPTGGSEALRQLDDGLVLVDMVATVRGGNAVFGDVAKRLAAVTPKLRGIIVDLRYGPQEADLGDYQVGALASRLVPRAVRAPAEKWLMYSGYEPQRGTTSGDYFSGLVVGRSIEVSPAGPGGRWRLVFLVNANSPTPLVVRALLASGDARLVSDGSFDAARSGSALEIDLGEGLRADVVTTLAVGAPRISAVVAPPGDGKTDAALAKARDLLAQPWGPPAVEARELGEPAARTAERAYSESAYPSLGLRLLAGCRAWGVIHYFYPYRELIGDWDAAFRASVAALAQAPDATAYTREILRLMAHVADGHTWVVGTPEVQRVLPSDADLPVAVRWIEGRAGVAAVPKEVRGIAVGDVIESIDGEPIADRVARLLPFVPAATAAAQRARALDHALSGPPDSRAVLRVSGADGHARTVVLKRKSYEPEAPTTVSAWRRLRPRVGYADLRRLQIGEVDAMLDDLRDTEALILDMRGYPNGTAWPLASRLNVRGAKIGALFRRPEVSGPTAASADMRDVGMDFAQPLPEPRSRTYRGKVAVLIDERAISQAEHTCLFLEQAAGATFIGTPTAGSNGDVTSFPLPGGLWVYFTGHDVRHADGRQLQRVGIQPEVRVEPTLAGLRAGRDEVLERAIAWAEQAIGER